MAQDILIVDDEADIRTLTAGILEDEGYDTREAADSQGALEALSARQPSLVLLDIWLQGSELDGLQILKRIKQNHPEIPVLMMSGHGTVETAVTAIKDGAYDFIEKPFKADRLLLNVRRAVEAARLRSENEGDRPGGAVQQPNPDLRTERKRQGDRGTQHPRALQPCRRALRHRQLRDHGTGPGRNGTVRHRR